MLREGLGLGFEATLVALLEVNDTFIYFDYRFTIYK